MREHIESTDTVPDRRKPGKPSDALYQIRARVYGIRQKNGLLEPELIADNTWDSLGDLMDECRPYFGSTIYFTCPYGAIVVVRLNGGPMIVWRWEDLLK